MRDKVKRFISILMTALMLVNLMPVGALAEGFTISNSVQSKGALTADSGTAPIETGHVYVYVKIDGASPETLAKFKLNSSGWYTIGSIAKTMPGKAEWKNTGSYYWPNWKWVITPTPSDTKTYKPGADTGAGSLPDYSIDGLVPWEDNKLIPLGNVNWTGYKLTTGANNYQPESIASWHMDGIVNFKDINVPYTVKHVVQNSSPEKVLKEETKNQKYGEWTQATALTFEGYKHVGEIVNQTIGDDPITIYVYYEPDENKKVRVTYSAEAGGYIAEIGGTNTQTIHKDIQVVTGQTLTDIIAVPKAGYVFDGWYRINKNGEKKVSEDEILTIAEATDNLNKNSNTGLYESTVYHAKFKKAQNLSYTVNYLEQGTDKVLHTPATKTGVTFETVIDPADEVIAIEGYNYVGADKEELTIGTDENVLTLYYTKKTDLSYTVNYYWNGTETPVKPSKTVINRMFGDEVQESPIGADGYTPVSTASQSITIGADSTQNVITFYYYKNVTLTANSDTKIYNGQEQGVSGFTGAPEGVTFVGITTPSAMGKDADTYTVAFNEDPVGKVDTTEKYIVTKANNGQLVINKRVVTLTSETDSKPYDGTPLTRPVVKVDGDGFVSGEVSDIKAIGSVTHVSQGEVTNTIVYTTGANFKESNYTITKNEGKLSITPLDGVVVTIKGRTKTVTYNGNVHTAWQYDVTNISDPLYITAPGEVPNFWNKNAKGASETDAGTYPMGWEAADFENTNTNFSNVTFVVEDGQLVIEKRKVTLTSASDEKVYDGTALTNGEVTVSGDGFAKGEGATYKVTGTQTNVGSSDNTFTYELNSNTKADNYTITESKGKLEVKPVADTVTVTIKGHKAEAKYDGQKHTAEGYDVSTSNALYTAADFKFTGTDSVTKTDAGTYAMGLDKSQFENKNGNFSNVTFVVEDGQLEIKKREVTLTSASDEKVYDGTALTNGEVTVSGDGFAKGEGATYKVTGTQTNVGSSDNTFTYELNSNTKAGNYTITESKGKLSITPVTDEVLVEITGNTASVTYDGTPHEVEGYVASSISNPLYKASDFTYHGDAKAEGTDATTYPMNLAETRFENTNTNFKNVRFEVVEDGQLVINPRPVMLASANLTKVYDGTALTNGETPVTEMFGTEEAFPEGEGLDYTFTGSQTDVGSSENTFTYAPKKGTKEDNYTFEVKFGTLEVTPVTDKVTVTIKGGKSSVTYNGEEHTVSGYKVADISNPLYTANDFSFSGTAEANGKNAGTYKMGLKAADFANTSNNFKNVEFVVADGQLEITKRPVMLTSADLTKVYDGTPLKNGDTPVKEEFGTEDAFPEGEGVTYTFKGSQTNAGSSKNMFTYAWNEGTNKDNYTIYQVEGDLVVTPIDGIKVTITGHKDTQTYDGKEHSVFGYDVTVSNALYNPKEDMQFNGTDVDMTAKGTDAGQYDIGLTAEHFTNKSNNFTNVTFVVTDGYVKITPRAVTLTSETAGKTYDGTALEKPVVTVGGDGFVEGQVKEIKATGSVTNAGSVANTITFTPNKETFKDGNYAITKTEGTLTIAKRSVLITSQSATKTYDGSALTRPAVTITGDGFVSGELAKAEATGSITNVGSTPNAIQYTTTGAFNAANYSIALSVGTLTVTEKPQPEPRRTFNLTVNYVYQNGKRAAASYNRGGLKNGETFDITSPVIAGYTASETVVSGTIYNRDIKVTVIYTADGVNLDDYGVPLGLGNITMNVGDCFE